MAGVRCASGTELQEVHVCLRSTSGTKNGEVLRTGLILPPDDIATWPVQPIVE